MSSIHWFTSELPFKIQLQFQSEFQSKQKLLQTSTQRSRNIQRYITTENPLITNSERLKDSKQRFAGNSMIGQCRILSVKEIISYRFNLVKPIQFVMRFKVKNRNPLFCATSFKRVSSQRTNYVFKDSFTPQGHMNFNREKRCDTIRVLSVILSTCFSHLVG